MSNKWVIDPTHSEIEFKVKHLMISTVTGKFSEYTAELETSDAAFSDAKINFSAAVKSISTGQEQRDGHLLSDDFFNAEQFPNLSFKSSSFVKKEGSNYELNGDLTIRDITLPVNLAVEFNGLMTDPYGNEKAGFEISGKISRKDYNLKWTATTEAGGIVVSDEVRLLCNIQMTKIA